MAAKASLQFRLFVAKLPWTVCGDTMRNHFQQFGKVLSSRVIFDNFTGRSKKYGFVAFETEEALTKALDNQEHYIDGAKVAIQPIRQDEQKKPD